MLCVIMPMFFAIQRGNFQAQYFVVVLSKSNLTSWVEISLSIDPCICVHQFFEIISEKAREEVEVTVARMDGNVDLKLVPQVMVTDE